MLARICLNGVFVRVCILFVFVFFFQWLNSFRKRDKGQKGDENGKGEKGMSKSL